MYSDQNVPVVKTLQLINDNMKYFLPVICWVNMRQESVCLTVMLGFGLGLMSKIFVLVLETQSRVKAWSWSWS